MKSYHSSDNTIKKMKERILKTKAENILDKSNRTTKEGIAKTILKADRSKEIAAFNSANMEEFTKNIYDSSSLSIFKGFDPSKKQSFVSDETVSKPILESFYKNNLFSNLSSLEELSKNQSGTDLMKSVILKAGEINYNLSNSIGATDLQATLKGANVLERIKKDGGHIIDFDIESLGGVNSKGHQQMDYITEIAAVVKQVEEGGASSQTVEEVATVFGFSKKEHAKLKSHLETLKSKHPSNYTSQDRVYLSRLSRAADPNIKYGFDNGFDIRITDTKNALSDKELASSVENALKGLDTMRGFGQYQEEYLKKIGYNGSYENFKKEYVTKVQSLVTQGKSFKNKGQSYADALVTGHNILNFDFPGIEKITGEKINITNTILDTLQQLNASEEFIGQGIHTNAINPGDIKNLSNTKNHGTGTQDFARAFFGIGDGQAHNALIDVTNHYDMIMSSGYGDQIQSFTNGINKNANGLKGVYIQRKIGSGPELEGRVGVFLNPKSSTIGYGNNNNALSFVYNPLDDTFMSYNGYKVNKTSGEVVKQDFQGWGPKANALYEKKVYEIDFNADAWKEQFKAAGMSENSMEEFYQQYSNLNKVHIIESKEFIDKQRLIYQYGKDNIAALEYGNGKTYYDIITKEEDVATALSLKVGYKNNDGSFSPKKESIEALGLTKMKKTATGEIAVNKLNVSEATEALLDRSSYRMHTDSAARTIREASYSRFQAQRLFSKKNVDQAGNPLKISQVIAEQISKNKDLTLDITTPLIEELGWMTAQGRKIVPERLTKATIIEGFLDKGENIFQAMENIFSEKGLADNYDEFTSSTNGYTISEKMKGLADDYKKKDFIYSRTLEKTLESLSSEASEISGSVPAILTKFEANTVDFDMFELFPELNKKRVRGSVANASMDIQSINLNSNDALLKIFTKGKFGSNDVIPNSEAIYSSLVNAYKTIGEDLRFEGVWGDFSLDNVKDYREGNLSLLNDKMLQKMRTFTESQRKTNKAFGYMFERTVQDPLKSFELLNSKSVDEIQNLLKANYVNVDTYMNASNAANSNDVIEDIVNKYFMTFKESELEKQISDLNIGQQNAMRSNYKLAKKDAYARTQELLEATGGKTGVDLIMSGDGDVTSLFFSRGSEIRELDFHKYTLNNGVIQTKIGGNNYSVGNSYNTSSMVKNGKVQSGNQYGKLKISMTNKIQNSIDHTSNLTSVAKSAINSERDVMDDMARHINSTRNGMIRESLTLVEKNTYSETIQKAMMTDTKGLMAILPELDDVGIIDEIISRGGIEEQYATMFKDSIKEMRNKKNRPRSYDEIFSKEKAIFFQAFDAHLTEVLQDKVSFDDDITKEVAKQLRGYVKVNQYVKGEKTADTSPSPHGAARFTSDARPPVYQYGKTQLYDKSEIDKAIELGKLDETTKNTGSKIFYNIFNKSNITTATGEKYIYNIGEEGNKKTSGLTLKYLQMDSKNLRNTIINHKDGEKGIKRAIDIFGENARETLLNKTKSLNTYEQQGIMNSRVFDMSFHKANKQSISSKKELLINHANTIDLINNLGKNSKGNNLDKIYPKMTKEGKIVYSNGVDVKINDQLGWFGDIKNPEDIRSNFDGLFRSRYYKDGEIVSEKEINNFIEKSGFKTTDPDYSNKVIAALNKKYDNKLEVINKYQTYGHKVFNDTMEKSTTESLAMRAGSLDSKMSEFLKANGEADSVGRVFSKDYENVLLENFKDKRFDIDGLSFKDRYFIEKHAYSDFLSGLKGFEDVSQIVALDTFKHQSADLAITNGLKNLEQAGQLNDEVLDNLLGKGNWSNDNGKINFDNVRALNIAGLKEAMPEAKKIFDKVGTIENKDGETIGHKGFSHVVQVKDDSAGTYAGRYTKEAVDNGSTGSFKGVKFSSEMNNTLSTMKYNPDSMELTRKRYAELRISDEFNKAFGHVLDTSGNIKDGFLGKSMLAPVTERAEELMLRTPGKQLLSSVKEGDSQYSHLLKEFGPENRNISIDRAEAAYSYAQGKNAIEFNRYNNPSEYRRLTEEVPDHIKFSVVDLTKARPGVADDWMPLDIGGQGDTVTNAKNNPYTNNLMIKYGDKADEVIAIPRMPESHFGDSLAKAEHIKKLGSMQGTIQAMNGDISQTEKGRYKEYLNSTVEEIKQLQKKDITSKTGIAGEAISVRMDQAFFGKGSGITFNDNLKSLRDTTKVGYNSAEALGELAGKNYETFNKAMFNGKSLLQHYSEGKAIDTISISEEAFGKMGYFDNDFMTDVFKNMDDDFINSNKAFGDLRTLAQDGSIKRKGANYDKAKQGMMDYLEVHGDNFIGVRYPEIMEGSDTVVRGYLDRGLDGNQLKVAGHTGAKMRLDHDGDSLGIARAQTKEGQSLINHITNKSGSSESLTAQVMGIDNALMQKAVTDNWYWDDQVRARVSKEAEIASMSKIKGFDSMIEAVGSKKMIDGVLVSSMLDKDTTIGEYNQLNLDYKEALKMSARDGNHEEAVAFIKNTNGMNVEDYTKAFAYQAYTDENIAKSANQSIGEINATNSKIKKAMSSVFDGAQEDYKYKQATAFDLFHIAEEAAISAKSSIDGLEPTKASNWNEMTLKMLSKDSSINKADLAEDMRDWANKYTLGDMRFEQYWDQSGYFQKEVGNLFGIDNLSHSGYMELLGQDESRKKIGNMVTNDFINNIRDLGEGDHIEGIMNKLAVGKSKNGVMQNLEKQYTYESGSQSVDMFQKTISSMENLASDFENIEIVEKLNSRSFSQGNVVGEMIDGAERSSSKKSLSHAILEGGEAFFKGAASSGLAMGALGIAAGIMAVGFVGGRPRPADVHAMEEAEDFEGPMNGSLSDPGLSAKQGSGNGYVVNINAKSNQGRDHAVNAIQEALSSGTSSSINVSMNINDNYGNINDRDLERALAGVLM